MIGSAQPAGASQRLPLRLGALADDRLAQLVSAGRERAFAVLYDRYHQPLYRYCRSMLRNDADAQDALQSTFTSALTALRDGKRNAPFRPWLFRIAHNESVSMIRRRRDAGQEISDALLPPAASASDEADDRARMTLLMADLSELPERQRAALLMRELNGLSHADIAVALTTTVTAAKQAIFDARTALLEFSEGRALSCDEVRRKISERDGRVLRGRRMRSHLRDCSGCATFAAAIPERHSDLRAIAPLLPAAASASLLARLGSSASISGGGSAAGAGTAGTVGKLGGTALATKAAVGATVVVTAAAGLGAFPKVLPFVARGGAPAAHAVPGTHGAKSGAAGTSSSPSAASSGSATAAAHARANSVAGPLEHHSASARHANRGHASAHAKATSAVGKGSTPASPGASAIASTPGKSALPHGQSGLPHGQSGLPHGRSVQAPGHTGTPRAGSSTAHGSSAAHKPKAVHVSPGLTGAASKSASSPRHIKSSSANSDQAALATPPVQAAKGTSELAHSHAK